MRKSYMYRKKDSEKIVHVQKKVQHNPFFSAFLQPVLSMRNQLNRVQMETP
jgi:hypothetical protein